MNKITDRRYQYSGGYCHNGKHPEGDNASAIFQLGLPGPGWLRTAEGLVMNRADFLDK